MKLFVCLVAHVNSSQTVIFQKSPSRKQVPYDQAYFQPSLTFFDIDTKVLQQ